MNPRDATALPLALDQLFQRTAYGIRPGLSVIQALLERADQPQQQVPYIHVAGTNGKGSVCALLAGALSAAGYRTGLYTSPHLHHFNERIQIDGVPIPDNDLAQQIATVTRDADILTSEAGVRPATFFECATAIAWRYFREQKVDGAVIETGMGGRWDATNVGRPVLTIITPVDVDHANFLGDDLAAIATEKAGIIKPGVPVICGPQQEQVREVIVDTAHKVGAPLVWAGESVQIERLAQDWTGQKIRIATDNRTYRACKVSLLGRHQLENIALAVAALETLQDVGQMEIAESAIRRGLSACRWPGRLQVIADDPLVVLDVAHNPHGARALMAAWQELERQRPLGMIVGFLQDKDIAGCARIFGRRAEQFWTVPIDDPRGGTAEAVAEIIATTGRPVTASTWPAALDAARDWARSVNGAICIAGSLYLADSALNA